MLVLTRHQNEDIIIGGNVMIKIVEIRGDKVRIGIVAKDGVPIDRREVFQAKVRQGSYPVPIDQAVCYPPNFVERGATYPTKESPAHAPTTPAPRNPGATGGPLASHVPMLGERGTSEGGDE